MQYEPVTLTYILRSGDLDISIRSASLCNSNSCEYLFSPYFSRTHCDTGTLTYISRFNDIDINICDKVRAFRARVKRGYGTGGPDPPPRKSHSYAVF